MNLSNNRIAKFFIESKIELSKVAWPSRRQAVRMSLLVISSILVTAAIVGSIDYGFTKALEQIIISR